MGNIKEDINKRFFNRRIEDVQSLLDCQLATGCKILDFYAEDSPNRLFPLDVSDELVTALSAFGRSMKKSAVTYQTVGLDRWDVYLIPVFLLTNKKNTFASLLKIASSAEKHDMWLRFAPQYGRTLELLLYFLPHKNFEQLTNIRESARHGSVVNWMNGNGRVIYDSTTNMMLRRLPPLEIGTNATYDVWGCYQQSVSAFTVPQFRLSEKMQPLSNQTIGRF